MFLFYTSIYIHFLNNYYQTMQTWVYFSRFQYCKYVQYSRNSYILSLCIWCWGFIDRNPDWDMRDGQKIVKRLPVQHIMTISVLQVCPIFVELLYSISMYSWCWGLIDWAGTGIWGMVRKSPGFSKECWQHFCFIESKFSPGYWYCSADGDNFIKGIDVICQEPLL